MDCWSVDSRSQTVPDRIDRAWVWMVSFRLGHAVGVHTQVHDDADSVGDDITVTLDEEPMKKGEDDPKHMGTFKLVHLNALAFPPRIDTLRDLGTRCGCFFGILPGVLELLDRVTRRILFSAEVCAGNIEEKLGRVGMRRDRVADAVEVVLDLGDGAKVTGLPGREEKELIEELEGGRGRLVDTSDDNNLGVVRTKYRQLHDSHTLLLFASFLA